MTKKRKTRKNQNRPAPRPAGSAPSRMDAGLNVARRSDDTANHWLFARPETPAAAVRPRDRAEARTKAREEYLNNPYGAGFAETFALYLIGSGPRLRFTGYEAPSRQSADRDLIRYVEIQWRNWADSVRLAKTLRLAVKTLVVDGEVFLLESANPKREIFGINYQVLDPQRIGNPRGKNWTPTQQDGLFFDEFGNLEAFCVYDVPEYESSYYDSGRYKIIPADNIHFTFKENLPESTRGWSWFAPVLESMGRLRDYEDGVIEAAKSAANTFATIETQSGYLNGDSNLFVEPTSYYPWESHAPQRNRVIQLPPETTMKAFQPAQPATDVPAFIAHQVARIGRGMGLTRNRSTGSSHEYNFASGKLDSQPFDLLLKCLQKDLLELDILDRLFADFYRAILPDLYARFGGVPSLREADWCWSWPGAPLVDAEGEARANAILIEQGVKTRREIFDELHPDACWDDVKEEILAERERFAVSAQPTGDKDGVEPEAAGTRIREPAVAIENRERGNADDPAV